MVDLKLVDYIKRHLQKGYKENELKDILIKNKWDKNEVTEAFAYLSSKKEPVQKPASKPAQLTETSVTQQNQLIALKQFIKKSRQKGISDQEIKTALLAKRWPADVVAKGFEGPAQVQEKVQEQKPKQPKKPFNFKLLMWYVLAFIVASIILTGTIFVYYYVLGLSEYTINVNGEEQRGKCLELDCSDMKDHAFDYAMDSIVLMLAIGIGAALLIVLLYALLPVKNAILWIVNILYFLFLVYIGIRWIVFNQSI
jgi:hypothetical protein